MLNKKIYISIEQWRPKGFKGRYPLIYLDGISSKRSWGGEVKNLSVLVCIGVARKAYERCYLKLCFDSNIQCLKAKKDL